MTYEESVGVLARYCLRHIQRRTEVQQHPVEEVSAPTPKKPRRPRRSGGQQGAGATEAGKSD